MGAGLSDRGFLPRRNLTDAASGFFLSLLSDLGMEDKERIDSPDSRGEMPRGSRRGKSRCMLEVERPQDSCGRYSPTMNARRRIMFVVSFEPRSSGFGPTSAFRWRGSFRNKGYINARLSYPLLTFS